MRNARPPGIAVAAQEDRELLVRHLVGVGQGESRSLSAVYEMSSAKLNALLVRMLGDDALAEDVLQDVYVTVWQRAKTFDPARGVSPITWLVTIARNKAIDRLRSRQRSPAPVPVDMVDLPARDPSALESMEHQQDRDRLAKCIDKLESHQRQAIRSAFFDGFTYDELARRAGVPTGTMKSWIRRALIQLKGCLTS
ncbi:sigma-70 family RNA polymerase sigma factor [Alsobacter sp. KACC 23698]|uniref:Sigma-70 family RNA polymerase sigma factor n=1 Tax=Alsobacter sp. KACC 23698 TaxID=3149229 RepID=A0AAU7JIE7_9HYPH